MKILEQLLSEKTINELKKLLGEDLTKQVNEKLGDYRINVGEEKLIPKAVFDADKTKLKEQLDDRDKQLSELKKSVKGNEELLSKIAELESANKTAKTEYENSLKETRQKYALDSAISGAKAKNGKALEALLDKSKLAYEEDDKGNYTIKGFSEQVEALKKSDAYLFDGENPRTPNPQNPNPPEPNPSGDKVLRGMFGLPDENK